MASRRVILAVAAASSVLAARASFSSTDCFDVATMTFSKPGLTIVGEDGSGNPDPRGDFEVTVKDQNGNPITGNRIWIYFKFPDYGVNCPDVILGKYQPDPDVSIACSTNYLVAYKWLDNQGKAVFHLVGKGTSATPATTATVKVGCEAYLDATIPVAILDRDGSGMSSSDYSLVISDFFAGTNPLRSDFDFNGAVGASDLSLWQTIYFENHSTTNSAPCP